MAVCQSIKQQALITAVILITTHAICNFCLGQETNTRVSGIVKSATNEVLADATVIVVHEPTKNTYSTQTNAKGYFHFFSIKPGGPYSIAISYTGYTPLSKTNLFISYSAQNFYSCLQESEFSEFVLKEKDNTLEELRLNVTKKAAPKYGTETNIDNERVNLLPSVSRNLQDYVRLVPNAKVNGDGGMSLAGQNNKYNAFFIDGSNTNDLLGLANSGTAGGQTNSPPVSIEAIEEIKVLQSPYDVQYSNFTGGSINAITKSGSNEFKSSAWYFFRNEKMAGRSPYQVEVPGFPGKFYRPRLNPLFNQTAGTWASGAFLKNKLFYFLLAEYQSESQPQPFNFLEYKGNSSQQQLIELAEYIRKRYDYDPGSFLYIPGSLNAKRMNVKLDWNPNTKNKFTLSYRHNGGRRLTSQQQNSGNVIRFSNNGYQLTSDINSVSFEWKKYFKNSGNNRLLLTYNNEVTGRNILEQSFPTVVIKDGVGTTITFGSNSASNHSRFNAAELSLLDVFRFVKNRHAFSTGIDFDFSKINDLALGNNFGSYRFNSVNDFMNDAFAARFTRNLSLINGHVYPVTDAAAKYNPLRAGAFINDEIQIDENLKLVAGVRVDANDLPVKYKEDNYFNTIASGEIQKYYDLEGAISGRLMKTAWQLSPRFGFNYKIPQESITIRGGAGFFSGHILNVWASQIYMVNIASLNIDNPPLHFNPNPDSQPDFQSLGIDPNSAKGSLVLATSNYKYPTVFRTSISIEKSFLHKWNLTTEFFFSKNIHENNYTNVNILPPTKRSSLPGSRNVYSLNSNVDKIPLPGGNPYESIFLLSNNHGQKGFSYGFTSAIDKSLTNNLWINMAYSFGNSIALFDPGGTANTNDGQWILLETVNGKNLATRTTSDFDLGHRISAAVSKKINYGRCTSMITLVYNGQSGSPFSYVYGGSMINDNGQQPQFNTDLIYIPTQSDLNNMTFISNSNNNLPPQQQKNLLNNYIENDRYLSKHRGEFAERNGARLPFTHTIDLRIQQNFKVRINKKQSTISIIYDVFNFTNMLNKNWGRIYFLSNDNYALITFAGFSSSNSLTPQYQFKPLNGHPWSVQNSTAPGSSSRWISQFGVRISFE